MCVFDVRQFALLQCLPLHSSAVTCITVNDVEGYVVTGSADGDIKVMGALEGDSRARYFDTVSP